MSLFKNVRHWFDGRRQLEPVLQNEIAECGIACVTMIANYYGNRIELRTLRSQCGLTARGSSVSQLTQVGRMAGLASRPLRLEIHDLKNLNLPCVLHWALTHFVVLKAVDAGKITIVDPSVGVRVVRMEDVDRLFTGVAIEFTPERTFQRGAPASPLRFHELWTHMRGVLPAAVSILTLSLALQVLALLAPFHVQLTLDDALVTNDHELLLLLLVAFGFLMLLNTLITCVRSLLVLQLSNTIAFQIASNLYAHLLRLPVDFFERRHVGDITSRFVSLDRIRETFTTTFVESIVDGVLVFGALGLMLLYSPLLTTIAALGLLGYATVKWVSHGPLRRQTDEQISAFARKDSNFLETIRAIVGVQLSGAEGQRFASWQNYYADGINANIGVGRIAILQTTANQLIFGSERVLLIFFGASLVLQGSLTIGMLLAFIAFRTQFVDRGAALIDKFQVFGLARLHLERVSDIALAVRAPEREKLDPALLEEASAQVEIRNASFSYGALERPVFSNINLRIEPGESIAIMGESGHGKSTLIKCILGLLTPTAGTITIGGVPAEVASMGRRRLAAVLQNDRPLSGSIADNISGFDEAFELEKVIRAAKIAGLHHVIMQMPMKYNTIIGDLGNSLSAGQQQRLLIARAIYSEPQVIVMDEATSHLDILSEKTISRNVGELGLTRIIVAHRPETILGAKRIFVLENGTLEEVDRNSFIERLGFQGQTNSQREIGLTAREA